MSVTFDVAGSSGSLTGVTGASKALTIANVANRCAQLQIALSNNTVTVTSTLGGVSGSLISGTDSGTNRTGGRTLIHKVIGPASGAQTASITVSSACNIDLGVIVANGVDQTNGCNNGTFTGDTNASTSVTVNSNSGDLTASIGYDIDNGWLSPFTNKTLKWGVDASSFGGDVGDGTGNNTHTWTDQFAGQNHVVSGANFIAFVATSTKRPKPTNVYVPEFHPSYRE